MVGYTLRSWNKAFSLFKKPHAQHKDITYQLRLEWGIYLVAATVYPFPNSCPQLPPKPPSGELYLRTAIPPLPQRSGIKQSCAQGQGEQGHGMGTVTCPAAPGSLSRERSCSSNQQTLIQAAHPTLLTPLVLESQGKLWISEGFWLCQAFLHLRSKSSLVICEVIKTFRQNT